MSTQFTTIKDAINYIADVLVLTSDGAEWVYENTDCPDWDDPEFCEYDFSSDPKLGEIPRELVHA